MVIGSDTEPLLSISFGTNSFIISNNHIHNVFSFTFGCVIYIYIYNSKIKVIKKRSKLFGIITTNFANSIILFNNTIICFVLHN